PTMSVVAPPITARDAEREPAWLLTRLHEWVVTVDHKRLGVMYVVAGLAFFLIAGLEAGVLRWQLAIAGNTVVSPQVFNRLFTVHGTTMVFLVGIPIVFGFANYLVPLMIGAQDLAFPRLNAVGFWVFLFGALLLYFSFLGGGGLYGAGSAPDVGWFAYAPLTRRAFCPGNSTDYWNLSALLLRRPSARGVQPDGPLLRHNLLDHPRLLAEGDLRLSHGCIGVARDRPPLDDSLSPPLDRGRHGSAPQLRLRGVADADGHP